MPSEEVSPTKLLIKQRCDTAANLQLSPEKLSKDRSAHGWEQQGQITLQSPHHPWRGFQYTDGRQVPSGFLTHRFWLEFAWTRTLRIGGSCPNKIFFGKQTCLCLRCFIPPLHSRGPLSQKVGPDASSSPSIAWSDRANLIIHIQAKNIFWHFSSQGPRLVCKSWSNTLKRGKEKKVLLFHVKASSK